MKSNQLRDRLLASTIIAGVVASLAAPAFAQEAQTAEADVIIVTGSRIPQANLEGASPVTVVNAQEIKLTGVTRTEDLINNLPQAFAGQGGNLANGASGTATVDLRNLGPSRTLVLVNGKRLLPGDPTSPFADINMVPASIIKRVDVLTGGASSVYGSDAVAGVVNFVMDSDFTGFRIDGQYSLYTHNNNARQAVEDALDARNFPNPSGNVTDGGTVDVNAVWGADFDDGRGHVTTYAGYRKLKQVLQRDRDYSACAISAASAAAVAAGGNLFSCAGSATSAQGTFFTDTAELDGSRGGDVYQVLNGRTFDPGLTRFNYAPYNHFQRPDERYTAGAFAEYEISSAIKPYLEFMFMDDRTVAQIAPSGDFGNTLTINCDNPLLSAQQLAIVCAANNLTGLNYDNPDTLTIDESSPATAFIDQNGNPYNRGNLQILRRNVEGGGRQDDLQHTSFRIVGGVKGDLSSAFSYDASYQFGRVNFAETYQNDFSVNRLTRALDVVDDGTGTPVCRSTLDGTDPNCVPYDIFAPGGVTPEAIAYLQTPGFQRGRSEETVATASITGLLGEYGLKTPWAEDGLGINVGVEYRKELIALNADTAFQTGDLAGQGSSRPDVGGSFNVKEGFIEARLPIAQNVPFAEELTIAGGYRYSKYKNAVNSFSTDTYKIEGDWAPTRDLRVRASYNRAVRAPNAFELFDTQRVALDGVTDPCAGDFNPDTAAPEPSATAAQCALTGVSAGQYGNIIPNPAEQYNGFIGGEPNLDPETATTYTVGVVLTPTFLPGFSATVDYFNIKIKDTISVYGADTILNTCLESADPTFCSLINRDQFGSIWRTNSGYVTDLNVNIGSLKTAGIDVSLGYNREIGNAGSLGLSFVGTWMDKLVTDNGLSTPYDCAGYYGAQCGVPSPEWRHKARVTWDSPWNVGLSLAWRYFGKVEQETASSNPTLAGAVQPGHARIKAQNYFDLAATFRMADHYTFRIGANNLFDRDPPVIGSQALPGVTGSGNTFPQVYDALGRYVYAGVTLDF